MELENSIMDIRLFDGFTMMYHDFNCNFSDYLSKQSLNLLEVLIINFGTSVPREKLMELFWENSENPASSLKFNIFRLRKLLKEIPELEKLDIVKTEKGGYRFDPGVPCMVDCAIFQKQYNKVRKHKDYDDQQAVDARLLTELYAGELYHDDDYLWFTQHTEFYRGIYLEVVKKLCEYYLKHEQYIDLKVVSLKAATLEPSVEENHFYYIQSLINLGDHGAAFEYYQKSTRMLVNEYAVSLSEKMKDLYSNLVNNKEEKTNIEGITAYYQNKEVPTGALYCDNTVFDYIYEMHLRNAKRDNIRYFMFVFEIKSEGDDQRIEVLQEKARISIQNSLRSGDVFMKLNKYQFLALMPCPSEELAYKIAQRIATAFQSKVRNRKERLHYYVQHTSKKESD